MLTAGFNHRGQTLLHFGTIGLGPKSKRTWILYSARSGVAGDIRPSKTEADPVIDLGRNSDSTERGSMRWLAASLSLVAIFATGSAGSPVGNYPFWTVGPRL